MPRAPSASAFARGTVQRELRRDLAEAAVGRGGGPSAPLVAPRRRKLTYNEQRELESLPARIAALEDEQKTLEARALAPEFYKEGGDTIRAVLERTEALGNELHVAYERWLELESIVQQ